MHVTKAVCALLLSGAFMGAKEPAKAQTSNAVLRVCVEKHLADVKKNGPATEISPNAASELVYKISHSLTEKFAPDFSSSLSVIPCGSVDKAYAWYPEGEPSSDLSSKNWIIYNSEWVRETTGTNRDQAIVVFGHELGHHINGHFTWASSTKSRVEKEAEADGFAGCAMAVMDGEWTSVVDVLRRLRLEARTGHYLDRAAAIEEAEKGFSRCGGIKNATLISTKKFQLPPGYPDDAIIPQAPSINIENKCTVPVKFAIHLPEEYVTAGWWQIAPGKKISINDHYNMQAKKDIRVSMFRGDEDEPIISIPIYAGWTPLKLETGVYNFKILPIRMINSWPSIVFDKCTTPLN